MPDPKPSFSTDDPEYLKEGGDRDTYEVYKKATDIATLMSVPLSFDVEHASPRGRRKYIADLADELLRISDQIEALPFTDDLEKSVLGIAMREFKHAAEIVSDSVKTRAVTDAKLFAHVLMNVAPYTQEGCIVLNVLKIVHGANILLPDGYLRRDGTFGFPEHAHSFSAGELARDVQDSVFDINRNWQQKPANLTQQQRTGLTNAGQELKNILEGMISFLDMTKDDPLEQLFRLVSEKIEATVRSLQEYLELPTTSFFSSDVARIRQVELHGRLRLKRFDRPKSSKYAGLHAEMQDALILTKIAQRIADSRKGLQ